jgi:hypothetical protein
VIILFVSAFIHIIVFKQGAYIHEYWLFYFSVPLAMSSTLALFFFSNKLKNYKFVIFVLFFVVLLVSNFFYLKNDLYSIKDSYPKMNYEIGKLINQKTSFNDTVLVNFYRSGPFLEYYSDRHIVYDINSTERFNELNISKSFFVVNLDYYIEPSLLSGIKNNYSYSQTDNILFFNLSH